MIHASSVAVSREHRRAKIDRLDTELLKRGFLGWLRAERGHCSMARVPTVAEEDAKRPNRERDCLVGERTRIVNRKKSPWPGWEFALQADPVQGRRASCNHAYPGGHAAAAKHPSCSVTWRGWALSSARSKKLRTLVRKRLEQEPETGPQAMVRRLARIVGVGVETADMLVHEVLSRPMRDRRAVARYAGLTGSRDESDARRREQGLARAGNARVRRGMIQLAWRFPMFQKESALALWYRARTADSRSGTRKTMIVPLARKLIIALWRFVTAGEPLEGVVLRIVPYERVRIRHSAISDRQLGSRAEKPVRAPWTHRALRLPRARGLILFAADICFAQVDIFRQRLYRARLAFTNSPSAAEPTGSGRVWARHGLSAGGRRIRTSGTAA